MEMQEMNAQAVARQYRMKKTVVVSVGLLLFVLVAAVAFVLCNFQLKYTTQEILSKQRDIQQAWVDKSLESVRAWRNKLVEQARFISSAEMFRLFAADVRGLGPDRLARLSASDAARSEDEALRSMAEQLSYMQDILQDFVRRRGWTAARVVAPDGTSLVAPAQAASLSPAQIALVRRADTARALAFGPVRNLGDGLVMDMVDPLYEVLGEGDPKPVAFLLLTVPVEKAMIGFLTQSPEQHEDFQPRIWDRGPEGLEVVLLRDGKAVLVPAAFQPGNDLNLPFMRRNALAGGGEVYSLGAKLTDLDWCLVVEVPASLVDSQLEGQATQIYGLGVLGSLGVALLLAFVWASMVSRSHRATARHFQHLYTVIRQQKLMLDSINASLQAGLLLVDGQGRVQVCNPAFCQIAARNEEDMANAALADVLPQKAASDLLQGMERVSGSGRMDSIEISLDRPDGARLYRVTLFPFEDNQEDGAKVKGGCVGIFQDITEFRRRAEAARERQANSIAALVRAIESVDVNLIGHSQKMERVSGLLSASMGLPDKDRETLRLAARLSQVGKIFVPHHLLTKKGKLTPEEQQEVLRAPEYAYKALHDLQFGLPVPEAVYQMGERVDGTGQPRHLKGEEIVANARILAVVNAFCAMVSARSYRAGMSPDEAVRLLSQDPGFDPAVVAALALLPTDAVQRAIEAPVADDGQESGGPVDERSESQIDPARH